MHDDGTETLGSVLCRSILSPKSVRVILALLLQEKVIDTNEYASSL